MPNMPTFFFSHTRQDRDTGNYVDQFFKDLEGRLAQRAAIDDPLNARLGTIDRQVLQGADWDNALSVPLGTNRSFVAILTPIYFKRANCGKELYGFMLRSPNLGIDRNGALTNVENVLPIRWLREEYYYANTLKDGLIPPLLRRINYIPADDGSDPEQTKAIQRYRKMGLEQMVSSGDGYLQLLVLLIMRIYDMKDVAPSHVSFATLEDAFTYDWQGHFSKRGTKVADAPPKAAAETVGPRALASVVVFYVTNREFTPDLNKVSFADQLIAEPLPGALTMEDPALVALLADVRASGVAEGLTVFHAATNPLIPASSDQLLNRLGSLSESLVLTALVVDPSVWPGTAELTPGAAVVEEIIRSPKWIGPVLLPSLDGRVVDVDKLVKALDLPSRLVALPPESKARIAALRGAFVDTRGRVLRSISTDHAPGAEPLPGLKGPGAEGK